MELVGHLAEMERRKIYLAEGYGSLFAYCTGALRLSEHAAYTRIEGRQGGPQVPRGAGPAGQRLRQPGHATPAGAVPDGREPRGRPGRGRGAEQAGDGSDRGPPRAPARRAPFPAEAAHAFFMGAPRDRFAPAPPAPAARPVVAPLAPERFRVQFTVGKETHEKLRFAQDMLRREIPDGDPGAIFDRALTLLLEEVARAKMAATAAPGPDRITAPGSRHIPAAVKRAVWFRDRGQCAFVSRQGRRCRERSFLELHHIQPFALGGEATTDNIALRCRGHNAHEAEQVFGAPGRPGQPLLRADVRDLFLGVHLVADELKARGQLGDVEAAGRAPREVEAELLELVLGHLAPDAQPLEDAHGLGDRLLASLDHLELALEEPAVLRQLGAVEAGAGLGHRGGHGGPLALGGLLLEVGLPRGQLGG